MPGLWEEKNQLQGSPRVPTLPRLSSWGRFDEHHSCASIFICASSAHRRFRAPHQLATSRAHLIPLPLPPVVPHSMGQQTLSVKDQIINNLGSEGHMWSQSHFFLNNPLKMYKPFLACGLYKNRPPAVVCRPLTPALQFSWRASDAPLLPQMLVAQVESRGEKANQAPPRDPTPPCREKAFLLLRGCDSSQHH